MTFSAEQTQKFKEAFNYFDADNSGQISSEELQTVMQKLGYNLTGSQIETIMNHIDSDKSGAISFDEFLQFIEKAQSQ